MRDSAFLDVDRYGVLRVPAAMWFALAVLARHWVLMLVVAVSARRNAGIVALLGEEGIPWTLLAIELPAIVLAILAFRRTPGALALTRRLWSLGPWLALAAAVMNTLWTLHWLSETHRWRPWPELALGSILLLDVAIVAAFFLSPYYKQLFSEFPAPVANAADAKMKASS